MKSRVLCVIGQMGTKSALYGMLEEAILRLQRREQEDKWYRVVLKSSPDYERPPNHPYTDHRLNSTGFSGRLFLFNPASCRIPYPLIPGREKGWVRRRLGLPGGDIVPPAWD
uniref:Uncharacterized protein n=1 Tax=Timema bartmani TaxID=61472 RepID=A0A7R9I2P5_9NEOP|nr:unnamed protein product [Timema bartmani]